MAGISWQRYSGGGLPTCNTVIAGNENGRSVFVIRAKYKDSLIPGKLVQGDSVAYICHHGVEYPVSEYEVLTSVPGTYGWFPTKANNIPPGAIATGWDADVKSEYFIGRCFVDGRLMSGKVVKDMGTCYIPYRGKEYNFSEYEVLVNTWARV